MMILSSTVYKYSWIRAKRRRWVVTARAVEESGDPLGLSRIQSFIIEVIRGPHSAIPSSKISHR